MISWEADFDFILGKFEVRKMVGAEITASDPCEQPTDSLNTPTTGLILKVAKNGKAF